MGSENEWTLVIRRNKRPRKIFIEEDTEDDLNMSSAINKYGKDWIDRQRTVHLKNIDMLAKMIDIRFGWGSRSYFIAIDNMYSYYGEKQMNRMYNGFEIRYLTRPEAEDTVQLLCDKKVKNKEAFLNMHGFYP